MIGVDHDADAFAQYIAEVVGLRERVHAGAVGGEHRMQRLDRERYLLAAHRAGARPARRAPAGARRDVARTFRQSADHENEALRADRGGFVDARRLSSSAARPGVIGGGNMPPRQRPVTSSVRADELGRTLEAAGLHDVAPRRDRGNAGSGAAFDQLLERPRLHRHRLIWCRSCPRKGPRVTPARPGPPSRGACARPHDRARRAGRRHPRARTTRQGAGSTRASWPPTA